VLHVADLPAVIHTVPEQAPANGNATAKIIPISEIERQTILSTIEQLNGDKLMAARLLGIGKTTLYRKLKEYSSQEKEFVV
jgi:two-component system response regulator HydG